MAGIVFVVLLFLEGLSAQNKMLWNDELYSQIQSIEKLSYGEIVQGKIPEGNNSPLFYILQKGICDVMKYRLPFVWKGEWGVAEPQAQILLRLWPNVFMSLAATAIFYVFAAEYSFLPGIYALLTAVFTEMFFTYGAEARPYALWICLTTFQVVYFLRLILCRKGANKKSGEREYWRALGIVNILLSLTAVFGSVQAFIVSLLLFVFYRPKLSQYVFLLFVPLFSGFYYFLHAPQYVFGLPAKPLFLIYENIPVDRFIFICCCGIVFLGYCMWRKTFKDGGVIWRLAALMILSCAAALGIMKGLSLTADPGWQPFEVSSRYFVFLAPVGIVAAVIFLLELLRIFRGNVWMTVNLMIIGAGFLILRILQSAPALLSEWGIC